MIAWYTNGTNNHNRITCVPLKVERAHPEVGILLVSSQLRTPRLPTVSIQLSPETGAAVTNLINPVRLRIYFTSEDR